MNPLFVEQQINIVNTISFKYWINVDAHQMEQVLINLLTNSIHALKNSEKQIIISAEAKENRTFIRIIDTGIGVEKEIENKIFLPFLQQEMKVQELV
jgi:signal transduction histidine kinase